MDQNFHYNTIRVLANHAGFDANEAGIVAYASQYTDHATEHKPIAVENLPPEATPQTVRGTFDPICTAHEALQYVTQWKSKEAQLKVYICFHFIPEKPCVAGQPFNFCVLPNSSIALSLLSNALDALKVSPAGSIDRTRHLIRTGIALHSYADTWAHQGFSGRWNPTDNDVRDREIFENNQWLALPIFQRLFLDAAPDVGHAEVAGMPDQTDLRFRYRKASNGAVVDRNNTNTFIDAASEIFEGLRACAGGISEFSSLSPKLRECFADSRKWQQHFGQVLGDGYDRMQWRREALQGDRHDWDRMNTKAEFATLRFEATGSLNWFLFHVEAGKHRDYVMQQLAGAPL